MYVAHSFELLIQAEIQVAVGPYLSGPLGSRFSFLTGPSAFWDDPFLTWEGQVVFSQVYHEVGETHEGAGCACRAGMGTRPLSSQGARCLVLYPSPDPTPPGHGHTMSHIRAASASSPWSQVT